MRSVKETIALARDAWRERQAIELAASPLGAMADWVRSGEPPPLSWFRAAGFSCDDPDGEALRSVRKAFVSQWGFSIPCREAVAKLTELGPLLEIGAGSGYWSALLAATGQSIVATDAQAEGNIGYGFSAAAHFPIAPDPAWEAVRSHPDRNVLCSWPTAGEPWALAAVRAIDPGQVFALIREPKGGCTGSPGLYRYLETRFDHLATIEIPQFPGLRDQLFIYRRQT